MRSQNTGPWVSSGLMVSTEAKPGKKRNGGHWDEEEDASGPRKKAAYALLVVGIIFLSGAGIMYMKIINAKSPDELEIVVYGFSIKGEVMNEKVIPAFQDHWQKKTGDKINFRTNYDASSKVANQVIAGAPAEVMIFSTEWDAIQLQKAKMVTTDWRTFPHNGTVSTSPWIIMTRDGNPKGIADFSDLTKSNVDIVQADPATSGGGVWTIFSIYGSELKRTEASEGAQNKTAARALLKGEIHNVVSWQGSARNALTQFTMGFGDALIDYESDAFLANEKGDEKFGIVYPKCTISSEHKVVIVDKNVQSKERKLIEAFVDFLYTDEIQGYFADYGFRSMNDDINAKHPEFVPIETPFTVDYLGGMEKAKPDIIDDVYKDIRGLK